jgi:hypothetical protein
MRKPKPMAQQSRAMCLARAKALADQAEARAESLSRKLARELLAAFYLMAAREGQDWPTLASRA